MALVTCAVCYEDVDPKDEQTVTTLPCGHSFHSKCIVESALRGHIACAQCRRIPFSDATQETLRENVSNAYQAHNQAELEHYFRRALSIQTPTPSQKRALKSYNRRKESCRKKLDKIKEIERIRATMQAELTRQVRNTRKQVIEKGFREARHIAVNVTCFTTGSPHMKRRQVWQEMNHAKLQLAMAMGYRNVPDPTSNLFS